MWTPLVRFAPERRWHTLLHAASDYQAWLLTWLPDQSTGLHDHGGSAGAVIVVAGTLTELSIDPGRPGQRHPTALMTGQVRSFGPAHVHHIANTGAAPAVSIHVYAPALELMRRYVLHPRLGLIEVGRTRAGTDW
jgi:predicted metal-dependent enzyme (double-stranded beta helix superfamily)